MVQGDSRRIVLACWGSYGDLFPYLALARALAALGHEPLLATCGVYRPIAERDGLQFAAIPPDVDPTDRDLIHRVMNPVRGTEVIVRELLAPQVRAAFGALRDVARGADLIVSHPVTFAAPLVARSLGLPWLATVLAPTSLFSRYDFPLLPPYPNLSRLGRVSPLLASAFLRAADAATASWTAPIRAFRGELGLPDTGNPLFSGQFSPDGTLALFSPVLARPQRDWPPRAAVTGFVFNDEDGSLPDDLRAFLDDGEPPIVFTLGTSAAGAPGDFYEESAGAVERLGRRAVMLVGRYADMPARSHWPSSIFAAGYAPHAALFRRALAVVHHGGVGTLAQALRAGRPMLVVPHGHDQPDNAARAARLGLARVVDARRYRAARAARHLRALVAQPRYAARAAEIGRQVAEEHGCEAACRAILEAGRR